ncbi:MAG: hypothetical protein JWO92_796 [Chitinophagaceae bacterium]|nr:hypothetical protein [Chitinophagaceae bacterium]
MTLFKNFSVIIGLFLILYSIVLIVFPPTFGSYLYGVRTKVIMKNKTMWYEGQRLFAFSIGVIGIILSIIGFFKIDDRIQPFPIVIILIALWGLAKYFVHKNLIHKYSIT